MRKYKYLITIWNEENHETVVDQFEIEAKNIKEVKEKFFKMKYVDIFIDKSVSKRKGVK